MTCRYCGAELSDDSIFCGACGRSVSGRRTGAPIRPAAPPPGPRPERPCPQCGAPVGPEDVFCRECGFVLRAPVLSGEPVPVSAPAPDPHPAPLDLAPRPESGDRVPGERFVLQFSTGESVAVTGSGLIGRNPVAQPGEFVDQFIVVGDAGKSVSKTHLEFGQEDGWFWVSDRYSTNGSAVREPGGEPQRCPPGRRQRVARGGRVDIGEQFFIVS